MRSAASSRIEMHAKGTTRSFRIRIRTAQERFIPSAKPKVVGWIGEIKGWVIDGQRH